MLSSPAGHYLDNALLGYLNCGWEVYRLYIVRVTSKEPLDAMLNIYKKHFKNELKVGMLLQKKNRYNRSRDK